MSRTDVTQPDDAQAVGTLGRDPRTDPSLLLGGVAPVVAAIAYSLAIGIRNVVLLVVLIGAAGFLTAIAWGLIRLRATGRRSTSSGVAFEIVAALVGPPVTTVYGIWVLERPTVLFGLIVALQILTISYLVPRPWSSPLQFYAVAVWSTGLLWAETGTAVIVGHLVGGVVIAFVVNRIVGRQQRRRARERQNRARAEALMGLLTSVQQVNSLQPQDVLDAVVRGLRNLGLVDAEVRQIDEAAGVARLVAGETGLDTQIEANVPLDLPLVREALSGHGPVVIQDATSDPRVTRHVGYHGGAIVSLSLGGGGRGLLSVATVDGPVTELQLEALQLLADHAAQALERASIYEADLHIVDDLRRLDVRTQDFISTASHELRTPLTVISGLGQTLKERWEHLGPERREDLLQRIDANAERLATIVRSLLDTSAFDRGELHPTLEPVLLRPMLLRLLDRLATVTAAYPVEVEVADDVEVQVDPALIEHVLENLLGNVAKHTPQGTRVVISAVPDDGRVRVVIADHGPGIAAEDLPHVLDRFYRGGDPDRRPSGGLGLGLALSAQIVQVHGGELAVTSEDGAGTNFTFTVSSASAPS